MRSTLQRLLACEEVEILLHRVVHHLFGQHMPGLEIDPRVGEALVGIEQRLDRKVSALELAGDVFLSEGRFGHLFKQEVGIPLRRYLLWRRLLMGMNSIFCGRNFTYAAHEAGFTDLAHFSHTCQSMFGLSLSDMFAERQLISVQWCDRLNAVEQ